MIGPLIEFSIYSYNDFIICKFFFNGNFININSSGIRESSQPINPSSEKYIFLGGSTIFGYGVDDKNTIPSIFSQLTKKRVY